MSNSPFDVESYNAAMQLEVYKLIGIGILLLIILIAMVAYSIVLLRADKTKKFSYIQLIGVVAVSVLLVASFSSSIISYSKDISEEAYIQYEGPATIRKKRIVILGNIPTWYNEYVISFDNAGKQITLSTRKNHGTEGDIEKLYIVYAQHSGMILEFIE